MADTRGDRYTQIMMDKILASARRTPDGVAITVTPQMVEEALSEVGQCFGCGSTDHIGPRLPPVAGLCADQGRDHG